MGTTSCIEEEAIQSFMRRTRETYQCALCVSFYHDPVEVKCGHMFCRNCVNQFLTEETSPEENCKECPVCQTTILKNEFKEPSPRMTKLMCTVQQFLKDFCNEGGLHIDVPSSINSNPSQQSSKTLPLPSKRKRKVDSTSVEVETDVNSSVLSGKASTSPSELAQQNTQKPQHKVHEWLMTNTSSVTSNREEDCENGGKSKISESLSADSPRVSSPFTLSSAKDSYDIVTAPSPPPCHDEFLQMKRGRGGRRGRSRKNALPISSGDSSTKRRGRSVSKTPDSEKLSTSTPGQHASSPELSGSLISKSETIPSTPITCFSDRSAEKNDCTSRSKDSLSNEPSVLEENQRPPSVNENSSFLSKNPLEKSTNSSARQLDDCDETLSTSHANSKKSQENRPVEPCTENQLKVPPNVYAPATSPQLEHLKMPLSTAHHLTPVSRPKARNSLSTVSNNFANIIQDSRRHSSVEGMLRETGQRIVSFLHKGRIVPKTPTSSFRKRPIVFTCLGKLGPVRTRNNICSSSIEQNTTSSLLSSYMPEKIFTTQKTQTTTCELVSVSTQTDKVEIIESCLTGATQPSAQLLVESQNSMSDLLMHEAASRSTPLPASKPNGISDMVTLFELDECSEDAFMSAEPFKRARVLSSSDEGDKAEVKRRKSSPTTAFPTQDTLSFLSCPKESKSNVTETVPEKDSSAMVDDALFTTVVMESDPESEGCDTVPPTPPRPPVAKPVPVQRKVFTCSGLPRSQVKVVEDWARSIGAEVSSTYTPAVTHVIVQLDEENCAQRTLKFLFGVASGKWIVGVDWVHQSIRDTRIIDEEPFEALDMDGEDGPRRARQRGQITKLFASFEFCCQEPFTDVTVDQLRQLLELCGASTVSNPSEFTKRRRHSMIIVQTDDRIGLEVQRKAANWFERLQVLSVSREWVLDCLASYQLLPVRSQLIGKHPESLLKMMGFDSQLIA